MNLVGTRLGKYELHAEIGRGGMAIVYRGYDAALSRPVAVKVLPPQLAWQKGFVERFFREAQAAAQLQHPHIVTIHDIGQQDGWNYIVMEYLEGRSLSEVLQERGRLSPEAALSLLRQLAGALDYAHERRLVHRDVKPANVMVDQKGHVTLTDFGLVRAAEESGLTVTGTVMGTPQYMSPEQASGKKSVGPASDLYSLGVIAYEMLSGTPPFDADSTPAILYQQVHEPPPPIVPKCPDLAPAVDAILQRGLAKEPRARYRTGSALVAALAEAVAGTAQPAPIAPDSRAPSAKQQPAARSSQPAAQPAQRAPGTDRRIPILLAGIGALMLLAVLVAGGLVIFGGGDDGSPTPTLGAFVLPSTATAPGALTATPTAPATRPSATPTAPPPTHTAAPIISPPTDTPLKQDPADVWTRFDDGMVMVYVPRDTFPMGSDDDEVDYALQVCSEGVGDCERATFEDEQPVHTVTLDDFWIDRTEVTNAQFRNCVEAGVCEAPTFCDWGDPTYEDTSKADHPVVCVDWFNADAYCLWVGGRLPTEAEWEYAARGPGGYRYPWGDTFDCWRGNFDDETLLDDITVPGGEGCDGYEMTAPVGSFEDGASWFGALDMSGNVWEWVNDWYGQYPSLPQTNPVGPDTGEAKVLRGGSWFAIRGDVRSMYRSVDEPFYTSHDAGFRCVIPVLDAP
jgi:formylglycine-generating enzyme required for sulfatase activity